MFDTIESIIKQPYKFKEIIQMLERLNRNINGKKISFDDNVTVFSPFNFKTGEVEPNFVYEEDSKNIKLTIKTNFMLG